MYMNKMIGLYVHQHWPYRHPYAARTWSLDDWRGYAGGLRQIGYNTILVWTMLEIMPDPLTPSDQTYLNRFTRVIDMLHNELGMRVYLTLSPNIMANDREASKAAFEDRHFYYCDELVDPGDPVALERLVRRREVLLRPLANVDGVCIIDSDPGCYPGSTISEFVNLLAEHRKMLDQLRPGIELIYWMHAGWRGWCRFYEQGRLIPGTEEEHLDTLSRLVALNPEPWGLANGMPYARELGIADKVINFNYGVIEGEPSFPMTSFGGTEAYDGGRSAAMRGVMGNAQTHCVQLPNIFAFGRGAQELPLSTSDFQQFTDDLVTGQGANILDAWEVLQGSDPGLMRAAADRLASLPDAAIKPGRLAGLLFNDPRRFLNDLVMMLRMRAARQDLLAAIEQHIKLKEALSGFIDAVETWQQEHGYQNYWHDPGLHQALRQLDSSAINAVLNMTYEANGEFSPGVATPGEQVRHNFRTMETYTPQLIAAIKATLKGMT
jgi:hypothetical protein